MLYPLVNRKGGESEQLYFDEFAKQVDSLEAEQADMQAASLFSFDPNTADSSTFLKLGFSPHQTKTILSYRNAGAWFSTPNDFAKLYVVSEEKFWQVKPYIKITQPVKPFKKVELNTADTTDLQRLRGIGPYYARQIVRYREYLGGFYSAEQLKEIKGIDNERFSLFAEQHTLDTRLIKRLNINAADESVLKQHPYIGSEMARRIVEYRQVAAVGSIEQLVNEGVLDEDRAKKLQHYLFFE